MNIFAEDNGEQVLTMNYMRSCPSSKHLFPETVRKPLKDLVSGVCPRTPSTKHISEIEFRVSIIMLIFALKISLPDLALYIAREVRIDLYFPVYSMRFFL